MGIFDAWSIGSDSSSAGSGGGGGGDIWGAAIMGATTLIGGLINSRGARRANQMTQQDNRENIRADREQNRETLRANMQMRQDDYQREVTRGRRAISPYRQMYSGPRFQFAEGQGPDAPIYNPLMEAGSLYQQLGQPIAMPWDKPATTPPRGR